jgi:basic membrane protein A
MSVSRTEPPWLPGQGLLLLGWLLLGCAAPGVPAAAPTEVQAGSLQVAMILPSARNDQARSQAGFEALAPIQAEFNARVAYRDNIAPEAAIEVLRDYGRQHFDLVIAHGEEYRTAVEQVASEFPRVNFALSSNYIGNNRNLAGLAFAEGEIGYLVGYIAGMKTKTNSVSLISGVRESSTMRLAATFVAGAQAANPQVRVNLDYAGSWTDADAAALAFDIQRQRQADVIALNIAANPAALHRRAAELGIHTIGFHTDHYAIAPPAVLTSVRTNFSVLAMEAAHLVQQGRWEGRLYEYGLRDGAISLAPWREHFTVEEVARIEQVRQDLTQGKIDLSR